MKLKFVILLLLLPVLAHAHPGHAGHEGDIGWGLAHPFTGIDHLLAALAVGLWAGLHDRAARWAPPLAFIGGSLLGIVGGWISGAFTGMETALAGTVLLFGASLAGGLRLSGPLACGVAGACAFVHGWAHGAEAPAAANVAGYFIGVAAGTAAICAAGFFAATLLRHRHVLLARGIGAACTAIAALLLVRSL